MNSLLITGYKAFELGILTAKDPRLPIIKEAIRRDLVRFLEEGVKWLIFTGNLGFEAWVLEVAQELKKEYEIQLATIFMFENQGENWNEANQELLSRFKQVDFVKYAYPSYSQPGQFKEYNTFLLENTDAAYLFYDPGHETNLKYLYKMMLEMDQYHVKRLNFDDLNEVAEKICEK